MGDFFKILWPCQDIWTFAIRLFFLKTTFRKYHIFTNKLWDIFHHGEPKGGASGQDFPSPNISWQVLSTLPMSWDPHLSAVESLTEGFLRQSYPEKCFTKNIFNFWHFLKKHYKKYLRIHKCDSDVKVPLPGWFWFVCSLQCKCGLLVGSL